ncbi:hypothetical protein PFTANZ_06365, partial [Plasmodium falciparum Tanzania (2000708)]
GDGHDCTQTDLSHNQIFVDLHCPDCADECEKYKKWREKQENEFNKQKRKYEKEIEKSDTSFMNDHDKKFYDELKKKNVYSSINLFLESLNHGKQCQDNIDKKIKTDFKNNLETFASSEYCEACPLHGVKCSQKKCTPINKNSTNKKNENDKSATKIEVLVLGRERGDIHRNLKVCKNTDLLKYPGIQKWICRNKDQIDQCNIENFVKHIDIDRDIRFNVLFQRWLRYFVKDYNKMREKLNPCIKKENGKEHICIKGCKNKCECVENWIKIKEAEWKKINQHYNQQKKHYTYSEKKKKDPYEQQLKGTLSKAQFLDGLYKPSDWGVRRGPPDSCGINHLFHTNINNGTNDGRNPCDLRNQNRFGENAEAYCNSDKIRVIGKGDGTACVPFRRQNMCDKNLEYLDNTNTDDTDDLLGNVLVTAKYEGESIVTKHPNKTSSDLCTSLARSFADIGDIVRGRDMFKRNNHDNVENGLKKVFEKINDNLKEKGIHDYNDISGNYYKLREDWWTINRDQRVKRVAKKKQKQASVRHDGDISKLKADAKLGQYNNHVVGSALKSECEITKEHTKDSRRLPPLRGQQGRQVVKNERDIVEAASEEEEREAEEKKEEETAKEAPQPQEPQEPSATPGVKPPCDIVEEHFKDKHDNTGGIEKCNPKTYGTYPKWDCTMTNVKTEHNGACMPPRRQKLCLINLQHLTEKTSDDLRKAFIKCAAVETCFLWHKYKTDNNGGADLQIKLEGGKIPEDFKRQMFYTFGDFRDLCLDTDISKNSGNIGKVNENINKVFNNKKGLEKENDKSKRVAWWETNGPEIWEGMLCALSYDTEKRAFKKEIHTKLNKNPEYTYSTVKFSGDKTTTLEEFAKRPQFLRWFTEWGDEYCRERKKKENEVKSKCTEAKNYEGCEKDKNKSNCVTACNAYKKYITDKKEQYDKQNKKFEAEKTSGKAGYKNYSKREAPEYLDKECLNSACNCMYKVKEITDYWTNPHKTYNTPSLKTKCACPPPPCEIVDAILGDKTSKSYAEGCKWKYKTPQGGLGWLCNNKGSKEGDTTVCIPPRRKRLYLGNLKTLAEGATQDDLRTAFIETAAIETFFAWHEFKKEKEREYKEEKQRNGELGFIDGNDQIPKDPDNPQNKIRKNGEIHEEFKSQMFYTLADYRDILFGNNIGIGNDMGKVKSNIDKVFANSSGKTPTAKKTTPKEWWEKNAKDIWEGMLCALSYDTETKIKDEEKSDYDYNRVTFIGGFNDNSITKLTDFVKRPPYFRWLEEWGHEFCRKRTHNLAKIKVDCRAQNGKNHCDDDGFDCDEIGPNEYGSFSTFNCPSCAISCRSYKKWISVKKNEFNKQREKYETKIKNFDTNNYDKEFYKTLQKQCPTVSSFIASLKDGPCNNNNTKDGKINFNNPDDTFGPAKNCAPCPVFGVNCKESDCNDAPVKSCNGKNFIVVDDIKKVKKRIDEDVIIVSDNSTNGLPSALMSSCQNT